MTRRKPGVLVGTSGYQYDHWQGILYPQGLDPAQRFSRYAEVYDTVEINNTFYGLPDEATFDAWRDAAPEGFVYSLKYSRYGTHMKKLKDPESHLQTFFKAAKRLGDRLGAVLVQLPPNWRADSARLAAFLAAAPPARIAVELRDESWLCKEVFDVLAEHNAALVVHDMIPDHPEKATADFAYYRFHGRDYSQGYSHQKLTAVADKVAARAETGCDVFVYFNNDLGGHAVEDSLRLRRYLRKRGLAAGKAVANDIPARTD